MPYKAKRQCPKCHRLVSGTCLECKREWENARSRARGNRPHYKTSIYRKSSEEVRTNAILCWLCGDAAKANDPWQADHFVPAQIDSPLLPAHRSCNIRRGNRPATPHPAYARMMVGSNDPIVAVLAELGCSLERFALV